MNHPLSLDDVRGCLDGATPAVLATTALDGTPNITFLSQATYVDAEHLALSFQFFSKTRENILAHPNAALLLWHPVSAEMFRLQVRYVRTENSGPLFERMRAMLAGIASHTGMSGVFRLRGADVYRALSVARVPSRQLAPVPPRPPILACLRRAVARLSPPTDVDTLFEEALDGLATSLGVTHAMVLVHDPARAMLYAVASHGYAASGTGAEIPIGAGLAGMAARERTPLRLTHGTSDRAYAVAVRDEARRRGHAVAREVPWPGLERPGSQVAVPLVAAGELLGVLLVESPGDGRFGHDEEDALVLFAGHLAAAMLALARNADEDAPPAPPLEASPAGPGPPALVKHYREDDSVFLDGEYVIKGVAGAILWAMLTDYVDSGRVAFTNRELRLDKRIPLPELGDNLEARLALLHRRLSERCAAVRIERAGRGRLRLVVTRPLELADAG